MCAFISFTAAALLFNGRVNYSKARNGVTSFNDGRITHAHTLAWILMQISNTFTNQFLLQRSIVPGEQTPDTYCSGWMQLKVVRASRVALPSNLLFQTQGSSCLSQKWANKEDTKEGAKAEKLKLKITFILVVTTKKGSSWPTWSGTSRWRGLLTVLYLLVNEREPISSAESEKSHKVNDERRQMSKYKQSAKSLTKEITIIKRNKWHYSCGCGHGRKITSKTNKLFNFDTVKMSWFRKRISKEEPCPSKAEIMNQTLSRILAH